jgi:ribosome biogenesis GTPase / thiamine phosphate phosphatase
LTYSGKGEFHAAWAAAVEGESPLKSLVPARVTGREHHLYEVVCPDFSGRPGFECYPSIPGRHENLRVTGRFEFGAAGPAEFPATGDWVLVDPTEAALRIHAVLPRRSVLSRGRAGGKTEEQVLAANIDTLFLVFALDGGRNFLPRLLERGLVVARNSGAIPCIVLNKADLAGREDRELALAAAAHAAPTVPVVALSARTGEGIAELLAYLSPGETVGMLGKSGVGKSALVNALGGSGGDGGDFAQDGDALAVEGEVREFDLRGRHTTSSSHLYRFDSGILLIDSPGIRELKVWGDAEGLDGGFPEIAELADHCRFSDCTHSTEAGCAVLGALDTGEIDGARYHAFMELAKEQAWLACRNDEQARRAYDQKWKQISKLQKELKRSKR